MYSYCLVLFLAPASKEFSLKKVAFGQTPIVTNESFQILPLLLPSESHLVDDNVNLHTRTQGQQGSDHDLLSSDDDEHENFDLQLHDDEDDSQHDVSLNFIPLPLSTNSKKRMSKQQQKYQLPNVYIPVVLENDNENSNVKDTDSTDLEPTYTRSDGVVIELLKTYGTKENTVKYALKLIDLLFIDKQELRNVDSRKIDEDPRIQAIYGT
ncbi:unnamed protein product [Rotaria sp. Silwood2]|nr:unnamed protein product [Rotaria sp. Silwood2]CAF4509981.1 unnamed protein product [Rotaria sp. Silwood2]